MKLSIKFGVMEKFTLTLIILGVAALALISVYMGDALAKEREGIIAAELQHSAEDRIDYFGRLMNERLIDLSLLAANGSILADGDAPAAEKVKFLREFERTSKAYASISLYDAHGMKIADTRGFGVGQNDSEEEFIRTAIEGERYVSQKPRPSAALNIPVMYFAAPLYGKDGQMNGVVVTRMLSTRIGDAMHLDEEDKVEVLDGDEVVVFSSYDKGEELVGKGDLLDSANMALPAGKPSASVIKTEDGVPRMHVVAREQGFQNYEGSGWMVVEELDTADVLRPVDELRTKMLYFGIVMGVTIVILMMILVGRLFVLPLHEFLRVGAELEQGNYAARINVKSKDEIGVLSRSFNHAIERIEKIDNEHKQVDRAKTEFMSVTSHELRSPMTPMKAQLQMLKAGYFGKLGKKQKESLEIVLRNTERLDRIIVDMLEMSRIQAARLKFEFRKVDLSEYVRKMPAELASFMPEKKVRIEANVEKLPVVEADPDRVVQVLRNLLTNAVKFSRQGGKIIVGCADDGDYLRFWVQDFGCGIDEESQKRLFEPFFQAQSAMSREYGGTGLGLAICRGIVEAQNGKIWFESTAGKGTKFIFTVPKAPVSDIKPINLLITQKGEVEQKIRKAFTAHLGPMGEKEFETLRKKDGGLEYSNIHDYLKELEAAGVISNEQENSLEFEVLEALTPKRIRQDDVTGQKLVESGLIRKEELQGD